ncbi:MAG: disulfide bond formation protein B [Gammaproteobacteria bacterium]|nr:disulfide bond formation protein B [Gammaproteobacteria bacterium]MCH9744573.1 disulfide bond formation protein B [Gammaproteobacteria bacterium]
MKKERVIRYIHNLEVINSLIGLVGIIAVLAGVVFLQVFYGQSDCTLCALQRAALIGAGLSLLLNLRYGNKAIHWSCAILSACAGVVVSIQQILLHINSTHGYGSIIYGLHLYTWAFMCFAIIIILSGLMLLLYPEEYR